MRRASPGPNALSTQGHPSGSGESSAEEPANRKRGRFQAVLLLSTVFSNVRVVSATNGFQPIAPLLILLHVIATGKVNRHAMRFGLTWLGCSAAVVLLGGQMSLVGALYVMLYTVGPLLLCYSIAMFDRPTKAIKSVITVGLVVSFVSVAEQFLIGSSAIARVYAVVFADDGGGADGIGFRGARGFTAEPSHVGRLFVTFVMLAFVVGHRRSRMWAVLAAPFILMNRSASAFVMLVLFVAALLYRKSIALAVFAGVGALLVFPQFMTLDFRFVDSVSRMLGAFSGSWTSVSTLGEFGGRRIIQTVIGLMAPWDAPFGHGPASYLTIFREVGTNLGFNLSDWYWFRNNQANSVKPGSYVSQVLFDYGLLAIPAFLVLARSLRSEFRISTDPVRLACLISGISQIAFVSTTTIPWPWLLVAAGLVRREADDDQEKDQLASKGAES